MAYSVTKCDVGGSTFNGYHYEFLCESADDIADLPTGASSAEISRPAPGSLAFVETDSSARYILKNSREWGEYPMSNGGGGSTGGGVMTINLSELVTPSADGTESNSVHGSNGVLDSAASYVYPGTFEDLGNLDAIKGFWIVPDEPGNEAALWGNIIIYSEDEAEDPANVSEGELALTATTPVVSVETTNGIYALLPTGTVFAPGTGR